MFEDEKNAEQSPRITFASIVGAVALIVLALLIGYQADGPQSIVCSVLHLADVEGGLCTTERR